MSEPRDRNPYVGTYTAEEWKSVLFEGDARVVELPPGDARRPGHDPDPEVVLYRLYLYSGRLHRYHASLNEEGRSYEQEEIEEGETSEGWPMWVISTETGGTDCDGPHARYWKGTSPGGMVEGEWYSPSTEVSSSVYDLYARMAGY